LEEVLRLVKLWTTAGLTLLGGLVLKAREARNLKRPEVVKLAAQVAKGRFKITPETLRTLETAEKVPSHNTVYLVAAASFVINPKTRLPFTGDDFSDIAAEVLNPMTGEYVIAPPDYEVWGSYLTLPLLIQQHCLYLESITKTKVFDTLLLSFAQETGLSEPYIKQILSGIEVPDAVLGQLARAILKKIHRSKPDEYWTAEGLKIIQSRSSLRKPHASYLPQTIQSLLQQWMNRQARRWILERCSQVCEVSIESLEAILDGKRPADIDLARLSHHLIKPDGGYWRYEELERLNNAQFRPLNLDPTPDSDANQASTEESQYMGGGA